ncbi:MAG: AAA family ATPase [Planctomycetes bacterium]|nr:AAA family ATPase [Planctomycetota bacterium]
MLRPEIEGDPWPGEVVQSNDARLLEWVSSQLLAGRRLFVSGGAGSGKTTFVKHLLSELLKKFARGPAAKDERVVVAASTGLAATQLASVVESLDTDRLAGPFTLHRAAMIPRSCDPDRPENVSRGQQDLADVRVVIVDEISMTDQTTFDRFMLRLADHTGVLVVGDFYQLPPVDKDADGHPAYAFNSPAFQNFELIELEGNHRQDEPEFAQHVDRLRFGVSDSSFYADVAHEFDLRYPVLFGTNDGADAHNVAEFDKIKRRTHTSHAFVEAGSTERALRWLAKETRALRCPDLKETMRVICVQNHRTAEGGPVANGLVGTVKEIGPTHDNGYVTITRIQFDLLGPKSVEIRPLPFKQLSWRDGREEVVYKVRQLPLRPTG